VCGSLADYHCRELVISRFVGRKWWPTLSGVQDLDNSGTSENPNSLAADRRAIDSSLSGYNPIRRSSNGPTVGRGGTITSHLDTLPAPSADGVDKVYQQLKDILDTTTAQ
jgi:hypothetical protein